MSVELYETLYMLDSNKMATDGDSIKASIVQAIEKQGGNVVLSKAWDESRKLAYPIRNLGITHKKAYFFIVYYKLESRKQCELDDDVRLSMTDFLIRYMTNHIDKRVADAVLDVAQKENVSGFALRSMQDDAPPTEINPGFGDVPLMGDDFGGPPPERDRPDRPAGGGSRRGKRGEDKPE